MKKRWIVPGSLLAVVLAILAIVPRTLDVNRYRGRIQTELGGCRSPASDAASLFGMRARDTIFGLAAQAASGHNSVPESGERRAPGRRHFQ
jgi:hypothetical protein